LTWRKIVIIYVRTVVRATVKTNRDTDIKTDARKSVLKPTKEEAMKRTSQKIGMDKLVGLDAITPDFPLYALAYSRFSMARFAPKKSANKKPGF